MHSRRDQLAVLAMIVVSLPFYWFSLELPKRIVNDAIQGRAFPNGQATARLFEITLSAPSWLGGGSITLSEGFVLAQLPYLLTLSCVFLALVLINGAFKYWINIAKGILGERLLRRLRFELFDRLLRLTPDDVRGVKSAEVATMIKDEVEPIGGFFGDAFITPAFLASQALTALIFIMVQNVWLGLIAVAVISTQGFVIPRLRREQLRLGRLRQLESRRLAGRIGEFVDAAPTLQVHGIGRYGRADIGDRLARLFDIRTQLYRRKFAVKYLNNLIAQVTPFVFYTVGGYFALIGELNIGQLVAIIAAYRDLPPPIKELIDWDQQRADAAIKYEQVVQQFSRDVLKSDTDEDDVPAPAADAPFVLSDLRVVDRRGAVQLERFSGTIARPSHVALVGASGTGADVLAKVLGRQITEHQGVVTIGGRNLSTMSDMAASRFLVYAGSDPSLVSGSMRDNIRLVLQRAAPLDMAGVDATEASRTGTPLVSAAADWTDYRALGTEGPEGLDREVTRALRLVRGYADVFRAGSTVSVGPLEPATAEKLIAARGAIRERLAAAGLTRLVEPFAPDLYNTSASIGENILFGVPTGPELMLERLGTEPYVRAILDAEGVTKPLIRIGLRMAETVVEVFGQLTPGHPLMERYSYAGVQDLESLVGLIRATKITEGRLRVTDEAAARFIGLALMYIEPRHRLSLLDEPMRQRLLRVRASFRKYLPGLLSGAVEFYDPVKIMEGAPIIDNLLFGRQAYGIADAQARINAVITSTIEDLDLEQFVLRRGLDMEAGPGGRLLTERMRTIVHLVRAVIRRPDVLILDGALNGLGKQDMGATLAGIREAWAGRTLIVTLTDPADADGFDTVFTFDGAHIAEISQQGAPTGTPEDAPEDADLVIGAAS